MPPAAIVAGITAAGSLASSAAQGRAAENAANVARQSEQERLAFEKETTQARENAYNSMRGAGAENQAAGESALTTEAATPNAALEQESQDIATKNARELQEGAGQMGANLAAQGVRGGQAATLINRGTGAMAENAQMDINKLKAEDEAKRQADLRAYQALKAGRGQGASTGAISF